MFTTLYLYFRNIVRKFWKPNQTTADELDLIIENEVSLSPSSNVNENARFAFTYHDCY